MSLTKNKLKEFLKERDPSLHITFIDPQDLSFSDRVRLKCFYCPDYSKCLRCPGNLPDKLDLEKAILESDNGAFIWKEFELNGEDTDKALRGSNLEIHRTLLAAEQFLMGKNCPLAFSFNAGRCQLCDECPEDGPCRHPDRARISLEATGCEAISSAADAGINISFSDPSRYKRVGLLCW